jgi:hypothetical protein
MGYNGCRVGYLDRHIPKTLIPQAIMANQTMKWYGQTLCALPAEDLFIEYHFPSRKAIPSSI